MTHYVTNKDFYAALVERKEKLKENPDYRVSNYIGECLLKISTNLAHKHNFNGYTYKDEMIADAIESCLCAVDKFDTEKYQNPFAYFTQCAFFAFVQRINKEKKQQAIKGKILFELSDDELYESLSSDDDVGIDPSVIEELRNNYYAAPKEKAVKPVEPGLTAFYDED